MTCAIVGIGRTEYSRDSGRTTRGMAVAACRDAIADAGLTPADVDGICTYMVNDSEQPIYVGWALGIDELAWANAMYGGGNLVADQIATAAAGTASATSTDRCRCRTTINSIRHRVSSCPLSGSPCGRGVISTNTDLPQKIWGRSPSLSARTPDPTNMRYGANRFPWTNIWRRVGSTSRSGYWTAHRRSTAR